MFLLPIDLYVVWRIAGTNADMEYPIQQPPALIFTEQGRKARMAHAAWKAERTHRADTGGRRRTPPRTRGITKDHPTNKPRRTDAGGVFLFAVENINRADAAQRGGIFAPKTGGNGAENKEIKNFAKKFWKTIDKSHCKSLKRRVFFY